ncbi:hypothetical protein [Syntrophotalea acetylenica]|uniref:hypothetical protein n=1 Tax=Syntrophotalea TaxID=2812025 RepID=UPI002A36B87C|nr:hypothetical protein [Syntrophotalea acetylenica]MDY0261582.1 hypothetical protein [Syntrophotalea acetylenica]
MHASSTTARIVGRLPLGAKDVEGHRVFAGRGARYRIVIAGTSTKVTVTVKTSGLSAKQQARRAGRFLRLRIFRVCRDRGVTATRDRDAKMGPRAVPARDVREAAAGTGDPAKRLPVTGGYATL